MKIENLESDSSKYSHLPEEVCILPVKQYGLWYKSRARGDSIGLRAAECSFRVDHGVFHRDGILR